MVCRLTPDTDGEVYQRVMRDIADLRGREVGVSDGAAAQDQPPAQAEVRLAQSRWVDHIVWCSPVWLREWRLCAHVCVHAGGLTLARHSWMCTVRGAGAMSV